MSISVDFWPKPTRQTLGASTRIVPLRGRNPARGAWPPVMDRSAMTTPARITLSAALLAFGPLVAARAANAPSPGAGQAGPEISNTAVLGPFKPHWFLMKTRAEAYSLYDGDTGHIIGTVPGTFITNAAITGDLNDILIANTIWSREDHGTREDLLQLYDSRTLSLAAEISLAPRSLAVFKKQNLDISADSRWAYVFNMSPSTSMSIVDLKARKMTEAIDIPGCALAYPWKSGGFSSLCGDGSLADIAVDGSGYGTLTHTRPFFDANNDPVLESSLVDRQSGNALFITYTGKVLPVALGAKPVFGHPWSLQSAGGLPEATTDIQQQAWRPGGDEIFAWHRATGRLYALMHVGAHWSHKEGGTEIWVLDIRTRKLLHRIGLPSPAKAIAISQDDKPQLYVAQDDGKLLIMSPEHPEKPKTVEADAAPMLLVSGF